jgi:hypothetical protein
MGVAIRLTSWRLAANAPDEYQNAMTILGAFGSCNGGLDVKSFGFQIPIELRLRVEVRSNRDVHEKQATHHLLPSTADRLDPGDVGCVIGRIGPAAWDNPAVVPHRCTLNDSHEAVGAVREGSA